MIQQIEERVTQEGFLNGQEKVRSRMSVRDLMLTGEGPPQTLHQDRSRGHGYTCGLKI